MIQRKLLGAFGRHGGGVVVEGLEVNVGTSNYKLLDYF